MYCAEDVISITKFSCVLSASLDTTQPLKLLTGTRTRFAPLRGWSNPRLALRHLEPSNISTSSRISSSPLLAVNNSHKILLQ